LAGITFLGVITLKIDDALEERLRRRIGRSRGAERGAISQSVEEAIELWLENPEGFRSRKSVVDSLPLTAKRE
jgi:hypothetical protein